MFRPVARAFKSAHISRPVCRFLSDSASDRPSVSPWSSATKKDQSSHLVSPSKTPRVKDFFLNRSDGNPRQPAGMADPFSLNDAISGFQLNTLTVPPSKKSASSSSSALVDVYKASRQTTKPNEPRFSSDVAKILVDSLQSSPMRQRTEMPTQHDYQNRTRLGASSLYHLHVYCHRHNSHITLTDWSRKVIITCSAGQLGFRKGRRKLFDSAYQLAGHVFSQVESTPGLIEKLRSGGIELVFRDFGPGREAFTKALLGPEGTTVRGFVTRVTDSTRFKYGGTRSPKPRRLG